MSDPKDTTSPEEVLKAKKSAWAKANRAKHPEKYKARSKAYYEANKEDVLAKQRSRYESDKETKSVMNKANYEANKDRWAANHAANRDANLSRMRARRAANKERVASENAAWRKDNPGWKYGISKQAYVEILDACNGRCPLCKTPFSKIYNEQPNVDHCHITGIVRGILCRACNMGLGHLRDNPKVLRAGARYLDKHKI